MRTVIGTLARLLNWLNGSLPPSARQGRVALSAGDYLQAQRPLAR